MMKTIKAGVLIFAVSCLIGCGVPVAGQMGGREPIVGGPCEGCEAVFQGLPTELSAVTRIATAGEPGEPMRIEGKVMHRDGTPAGGTIVYAYQTNARGIYPRDERLRGQAAYRHGKLRGWARADEDGGYWFDTIRPASYPRSDVPQHVHMHVIEPGRCTYFIDDIVFTDDPRLTPAARNRSTRGRGGSGMVTPQRDENGTWLVERNIILGEEIPDYSLCGQEGENTAERTQELGG